MIVVVRSLQTYRVQFDRDSPEAQYLTDILKKTTNKAVFHVIWQLHFVHGIRSQHVTSEHAGIRQRNI